MKVTQILSVLVFFVAAASAVPAVPGANNAKRQAPGNSVATPVNNVATPVNPSSIPTDAVASSDALASVPRSTGANVKSRFLTNALEGIPQMKIKFLTDLPETVWDNIATLENKIADSLKAGTQDEATLNQLINAWLMLFSEPGQIPDFNNLSTAALQ
ncbi:hypothetical protein ABW20_dc0108947 [Dactylellina cionopaga]|nr:hypothetical protein ABW20_dc0108947 [Dactylellina cionopaga]